MVKKKRVILSYIPTDKNLLILQNLGILNKRGRSSGKINFNEWLNRAVYDKVGIDSSNGNGKLLENLLRDEIQAEQRAHSRRNEEHSQKLRALAQKLHEAQKQKQVQDYESKD